MKGRVQRHPRDAAARSWAFPGPHPDPPGPLGSVLAPVEGTSLQAQEGGKLRALAWPLGTPRGAPGPSLSCLEPCPAAIQPLLVDLAQPCSLTHLLPVRPPEPSRAGGLCPARVVWKAGQCRAEVLSLRDPVLSPWEPYQSDSAKRECHLLEFEGG